MHENREIPRSPVGLIARRAAQGRPRPQAGDERAWEVRQPCSTCEPAEQGHACGCGGGGGKGAGQGEHDRSNTPRTQSRTERVKRVGSCARGSKKGQGSAVHGAAAPRRLEPSQGGLLGDQPEGCNGRGQGDMAGLRRGSRGEPREPARQGPQRHLSGKPITAGLHLEVRRAQAPAGHSDIGGQSPSTSRRRWRFVFGCRNCRIRASPTIGTRRWRRPSAQCVCAKRSATHENCSAATESFSTTTSAGSSPTPKPSTPMMAPVR